MAPTDPHELAAFAALEARLAELYERQFDDPLEPRSVVVVPSLSFDSRELAKIRGVHHYEERMLSLLMLLRYPRTHVVYLTSQAIDPSVIDYHLHLLTGVPASHARARLHLFHCHDASAVPLSQKLLERPRLLERIRGAIPELAVAHMTCFTSTPLERRLAIRLGIPLYACDPELVALGTKSGSRELFREIGIGLPDGFERLRDARDVIGALAGLHRSNPGLTRAVVKLDHGFSGEGNAMFSFEGMSGKPERWIEESLPEKLRFEAYGETWESYRTKIEEMSAIVECFIEGRDKRSPSAQWRIDPLHRASPVSTHDQVLGGSGHVFVGARFPADREYRLEIQALGGRVAQALAHRGVIGRFGVDFVSVREQGNFRHYALEINLRKGGTTHPYMVLQYLTDGEYDAGTGTFVTPRGRPCHYFASDNVENPGYRGLLPEDVVDIAVCNNLHYRGATQQGVVFHMISAASEFGKLGMVCIGDSAAAAEDLRFRTLAVLDAACRVPATLPPAAPSRPGD